MPKGRLRNMRSRLEPMGARISTRPPSVITDTDRAIRDPMYQTKKWRAIRGEVLKRSNRVCGICGVNHATYVDHLLGHNDAIADEAAFCLGLSAAPTWQGRFYDGPFLAMCGSCHSSKTVLEQNGMLLSWIQDHWVKLLLLL